MSRKHSLAGAIFIGLATMLGAPEPSEALTCVIFHQVSTVCSYGQGGEIVGCSGRTYQDYLCNNGGGIGYPNGPHYGGGGGGSSGETLHGNPIFGVTLARVNAAKSKAISALEGSTQCGNLAHDSQALGQTLSPGRRDIVDTIRNKAKYREWNDHQTCSTAAAFTTPYSYNTYICKNRFTNLSTRQAAAILIHEALHSAGLLEKPQFSSASMTTAEITQYVLSKCPNL
ncbi:MAG: hypothetical protein AAF725_16690 [Acidobacteriota bacterium]